MLVLTKEQYEGLPDYAKEGFALVGDQYLPVKDAALKKLADDLDKERDTLKEQLSSFQADEQKKIEEAAEKARKEAIEEAAKGGGEELEKLLAQQLEEAKSKLNEEWEGKLTSQSEKLNALRLDAKKGLIDSIIAQSGVTEKGKGAMRVLLENYVDVDEEANQIFKLSDGKVSEYKRDEFVENVIKKDELFAALIKPDVVVSQTSSGSETPTQSKQSVATSTYLNMATQN
jgi:hypothetical protein